MLLMFGISIRKTCAFFSILFIRSLVSLFYGAISLGLLILHFVHLKFIWFDGGRESEWCAYVKRLKTEKRPCIDSLWTTTKNAGDYCKFSGCIEKKGAEQTDEIHTNHPRQFHQRHVCICIEFRNIGKLNTCHLIFAVQNSIFTWTVQLQWHHTKMIAGLFVVIVLIMLRCCCCCLFFSLLGLFSRFTTRRCALVCTRNINVRWFRIVKFRHTLPPSPPVLYRSLLFIAFE